MILEAGSLYSCTYTRWHHDRNPLLFILYSDSQYTIGINVHYIPTGKYPELAKMFNQINEQKRTKNNFFNNNRKWYYDWFKNKYPNFIDQAYRVYFSGLLMGIRANPLLRTLEIGSKWREPRKGKEGDKREKIRVRAKKDNRLKKLNAHLKDFGFTKTNIKLRTSGWKKAFK